MERLKKLYIIIENTCTTSVYFSFLVTNNKINNNILFL